MVITLLAGLVLLGIAAAIGARALSFGRIAAAQRLRSIEMYGFHRSEEPLTAAAAPRLNLNGFAAWVGKTMAGRLSKVDRAKMRRDLIGAGLYGVRLEVYLGYRIIASGVVVALLLLTAVSTPTPLILLCAAFAAVLSWRLPVIAVQRRAAARLEDIDRELPELIDLLVVSIEAGVGLAGALQMMAEKMHGPLGVELRVMQQEQSMGLSSDQALSKLLERCETPAVRSFVRSLQQGERLGVSIGTILRNLAVEMRIKRRQLAEERAQKAPVKMLFPLVFLIFPSMFIVLLGPAVFAIKEAFG